LFLLIRKVTLGINLRCVLEGIRRDYESGQQAKEVRQVIQHDSKQAVRWKNVSIHMFGVDSSCFEHFGFWRTTEQPHNLTSMPTNSFQEFFLGRSWSWHLLLPHILQSTETLSATARLCGLR